MRRWLAGLVLALLLFPVLAAAQGSGRPTTGSITTNGDVVSLETFGGASGTVRIEGTWTGTVQFEGCIVDCSASGNWFSLPVTPVAGGAAVTSATAVGTWTYGLPLSLVRVRASAAITGTATVRLLVTTARGSGLGLGAATNVPSYVTVASEATLLNERVLTAGTAISLVDGGAGSTITVANTGVTSAIGTAGQIAVSGATGAVTFSIPADASIATRLTVPTLRSADAAPTSLFLQPGDGTQSARPVVIGTDTDVPTDASLVAYLRYAGDETNSGLTIHNDVAGAAGAQIIAKKSRGGRNALAAVNASDRLFTYLVRGYDGTNFIDAGGFEFIVDGTPGANDMPGGVVFFVTPDGATSGTVRLKIGQAGNTDIGANQLILGAAIGSADVGVQRSAAGVLKVTDAAAGSGALLAGHLTATGATVILSGVAAGAAGSKKVLCIDDSTGELFKSSSDTACAN